MKVNEYRELYEGLTQEDTSFRDAMQELEPTFTVNILSDLELAQNRLNHAMLGIHPLYRREVELSGIVDYPERSLKLFHSDGESVIPFENLDPSYVSFLESQKRIYNVKDTLPLSSVALKTSNQWLKEDGVEVPNLSDVLMHLPEDDFPYSRKVLETAFARSMVLMNHLHEEVEKQGLSAVYGTNRSDLMLYTQSNSFNYQFDYSVHELTDTASQMVDFAGERSI